METTQTQTAALLLSDFNFTKGISAYSTFPYSNLVGVQYRRKEKDLALVCHLVIDKSPGI